jgi:hypothetical protein
VMAVTNRLHPGRGSCRCAREQIRVKRCERDTLPVRTPMSGSAGGSERTRPCRPRRIGRSRCGGFCRPRWCRPLRGAHRDEDLPCRDQGRAEQVLVACIPNGLRAFPFDGTSCGSEPNRRSAVADGDPTDHRVDGVPRRRGVRCAASTSAFASVCA